VTVTPSAAQTGTATITVTVSDGALTAADTFVVSVSAATSLPQPWLTADIGTPGATGNALYSNGVYTLKGAGKLGGSADSLYFVYQTLSGDGEIKARVYSEQDTGAATRIAVMIRESLNGNSRHATMTIDPSGAFRFQRRNSTGGSTKSTTAGKGTFPNTWIRVVRSGDTITGYSSSDGANWTNVRSEVIPMANTIYVGVAVASGVSGTLNTTIVDNVVVVP
jgi:hypothetical protein